MGLGSALGSLGRAFIPRPGMTNYRTPSFLPDQEQAIDPTDEDPYGGGVGPEESDAPVKPPVSAASAIGGNAKPMTYRPDVDPDTQKYIDIARQGSPMHPEHGRLRSIGESLAGGVLGQPLTEKIFDPAYARKKTAYEHSLANAALPAKIRASAEKNAADVSHTMTASALEDKQGQNYDINQLTSILQHGELVPDDATPEQLKRYGGIAKTADGKRIGFLTPEAKAAAAKEAAKTEEVTPEMIAAATQLKLPGFPKAGTKVTPTQWNQMQTSIRDLLMQRGKPPGAEETKAEYRKIASKLAAANEMPEGALTDVRVMAKAIRGSKSLQPEEKNTALSYLATNTTPSAQGTTASIRVEGITESKPITVIDSQSGQAETMNMAEFNRANKLAPGRYVQSTTAAPAMSKEAIFRDINYNIRNAKKAVSALDEMDAGTRAELALALKDPDPKSAIGAFLTGAVGTTMTPEQEDAVIALRNLYENAMTLRSIGGMGQGSDQLRAAIQATLPSARTPNKGYALKQINQFEQIVQNLHSGVPGLGRGAAKESGHEGNTGGETIRVKRISDGKTGLMPAANFDSTKYEKVAQ